MAKLSFDPCTPEGFEQLLDMQIKMEPALKQHYGMSSSAPATTFRSMMSAGGPQNRTNDGGASLG